MLRRTRFSLQSPQYSLPVIMAKSSRFIHKIGLPLRKGGHDKNQVYAVGHEWLENIL
jgi:hypothetical protein